MVTHFRFFPAKTLVNHWSTDQQVKIDSPGHQLSENVYVNSPGLGGRVSISGQRTKHTRSIIYKEYVRYCVHFFHDVKVTSEILRNLVRQAYYVQTLKKKDVVAYYTLFRYVPMKLWTLLCRRWNNISATLTFGRKNTLFGKKDVSPSRRHNIHSSLVTLFRV